MTRGSRYHKDLRAEGQAKCKGLEVRKMRSVWDTAGEPMKGEHVTETGGSPSQRPLQSRVRNVDFIPSALGSRWRAKSRRMTRSDL